MSGTVLDTGTLIALDRGNRMVGILTDDAVQEAVTLTVPAGCVAQTWRNPPRQARLAAFLKQPNVDVVAMDEAQARDVGLLLAKTGTSDITDAHVAVCAVRLDATVMTSDPDDIRRLEPALRIRRV